ncbi:MAG: transcription termination/antitermination protein NusG [Acidimicrobiia bacterium]|nr:transcription termination/antitermination protein NusG [Acidimicrobiia bacterium]
MSEDSELSTDDGADEASDTADEIAVEDVAGTEAPDEVAQTALTDVPDPDTDTDTDTDAAAEEPATSSGPAADAAGADADEVAAIDEDELLEEEAEPEVARVQSAYDRPGRWFVVHTQSGYEKKVKQNLEARTASMNMEERILEVVIPMDDVVEFKGGKKVVVQKKMFPGYLLVRCHLDDDSWYVIRNTPGIVNFVGAGGKPSPLSRREVETFLHVEEPGVKETPSKIKARFAFDMGETVRVREGPFADFSGEIVEINEDQAKVKVLVNIFGRETPVELEFSQVAKL